MAPAGTFTVAVAGVGGAAVPGTVTYVAATNTATFAPTANLLASTHYTATITTAAQNAGGNGLSSNVAWSFTTGTTTNVTPPTVIATIPASGAVGVPTNEKITATFSAVMDPATITAAGTYTVVATVGSTVVPGTVTYAGSAATFAPTSGASRKYAVHRQDYNRGQGPHRKRDGRQLSVELYDRRRFGHDASYDHSHEPGKCGRQCPAKRHRQRNVQ